MIFLNQYAFIPALEEMSDPVIFSIIIRGIGNIKLPHQFAEIGQRSF